MAEGHIAVIGSINMDLVAKTSRMPLKGETILGSDFQIVPGGKGANQAVAAARLGGRVRLVGRVGDDLFGRQLLDNLANNHVDSTMVHISEGTPTGSAVIVVDEQGENSIIVVPGANNQISSSDIEAATDVIITAGLVLVQLEIPLQVVETVIKIAGRAEVPVILDPAPMRPIKRNLLTSVDIITPNRVEAQMLAQEDLRNVEDAKLIAKKLNSWGIPVVLVKLGEDGVVVATEQEIRHIPAYSVAVEDTTAAGDAFAGGLAVALSEGQPLYTAIQFANAVGALTVTQLGAQSAIPTRPEVEQFLKE
ncbi:MAG: ribokinase [Firmicutes bacterium]|nr:ribokinase [Bacillota bacterium]